MKTKLIPFKENDLSLIIQASITRTRDYLETTYTLEGNLNQIYLPQRNEIAHRKYDLWESTCFELFVKREDHDHYVEFNFAPNSDWNLFMIEGYRNNIGEISEVKSIPTDSMFESDSIYLFKASIPYSAFERISISDKESFERAKIKLGITSVIQTSALEKDLKYYAIRHEKSEPDFHSGFVAYK